MSSKKTLVRAYIKVLEKGLDYVPIENKIVSLSFAVILNNLTGCV